jgi:hypothetical protein
VQILVWTRALIRLLSVVASADFVSAASSASGRAKPQTQSIQTIQEYAKPWNPIKRFLVTLRIIIDPLILGL